VDHIPRNSRYRQLQERRAAAARRRRRVLFALAIVALLMAGTVSLLHSPADQVAQAPGAEPTVTGQRLQPLISTATPTAPGTAFEDVLPAIGAAGALATPPPVPTLNPSNPIFDPQRFSYEPGFYQPEIQAFLDAQPGPLKDVRFQIGDRSQSFAEVLNGMASLYSLNPKIMPALLEQQSRLLSSAEPSPEQMSWALGFRGEDGRRQGLYQQFYWGMIELRHAVRDYTITPGDALPELVFADDERQRPPSDISLTRYALARVLAPTTTPDQLPAKLDEFLRTYTRLFDDPRLPPTGWPQLAEPFLTNPMEVQTRVTSFFDHDTPFLRQNGSLVSFWGRRETMLSYDGHTGWDYGMRPPDRVLAAADGTVVFAGNSDDGCFTPARGVIIDHGNGYRTLYWHLSELFVETGQSLSAGTPIGAAGASGCAFGPHLHFQVQYLGRDVDPYGWCGSEPDPWAGSPAGQISAWLWDDMPSPCAPPPANIIVVDNSAPGFAQSGNWQAIEPGYDGGALFAATRRSGADNQPWQTRSLATPSVAIWRPELPHAGQYRVLVYIPYVLNGLDDSRSVRYHVRHQEGETEVFVDGEAYANGWADLGVYAFDPSGDALVSISTLAGDNGRGVWADAVAWVPVQ
jgi:murein DD-endopeptidase MepM/ murein hydrolase activator NlpD